MVLKACLIEADYSEETRHTVDIDANWNTTAPPSAEQMVDSLQKALDRSGIDLNVSLYRMYGEGRSADFELTEKDTGEILFSMDIDVNRPAPPTRVYEVAGLQFCGVAPVQMIADKTAAVSTDKVFTRIKDVVDLYYLSKVFPFPCTEIIQILERSGRSLGAFHGFLYKIGDLEHSYEKFRFECGVNKPPFAEIYRTVKQYIKDILPDEAKGSVLFFFPFLEINIQMTLFWG